MIIASFSFFLGLFVLIGILSVRQAKQSSEDYLVASRSVSPGLVALSAVSTNNSGFMFVGMIGYSYKSGYESVWMMIGWVLGDLLMWMLANRRIRQLSEVTRANSVPELVGVTPRQGRQRAVIIVAALLTLVMLSTYAAAQLKAGSAAMSTLFDWNPSSGAILGALIVVAYCFSGGIRASIWTDAAQSIVMIVAMGLLILYAATELGGPNALHDRLNGIDHTLTNLFPGSLKFGFIPFFFGMFFGGLGTIGQPHIVVRIMSLRKLEEVGKARVYYFSWYIPFWLMAIGVGLYARAYFPEIEQLAKAVGLDPEAHKPAFIAEHALPALSLGLMPEILVGTVLAGLFAATISTADSQILACSAAVTQDLNPRWKSHYWIGKGATLSVAGLALALALASPAGVFDLVLVSWALLGSTIGPVLFVRLYALHLPSWLALAMFASGAGSVLLWRHFGWQGHVYELLPGIAAPVLLYLGFAAVHYVWPTDQHLLPEESLAEQT